MTEEQIKKFTEYNKKKELIDKYFKKLLFLCKCGCKLNDMDMLFLYKLAKARDIAKVPFIINSGYRCITHNSSLDGSSKNSSHMKGLAVDIKCVTSINRYKIINALLSVGFDRIGIASTFIHVDMDYDRKIGKVIWTY